MNLDAQNGQQRLSESQLALIFTHGSEIHILQILQYVVNAC